ncbi:hypothetical protein [Nonomuraea sp. NPDC048916]|uniref:hypothetical protein n=1 Tax=Nonomuraea sp. NPDC048916 TaxID=3154232 RepID=UPI0033D6A5CC
MTCGLGKALHQQGIEQSRSPQPLSFTSVLAFHDAKPARPVPRALQPQIQRLIAEQLTQRRPAFQAG